VAPRQVDKQLALAHSLQVAEAVGLDIVVAVVAAAGHYVPRIFGRLRYSSAVVGR